DPIECAERSHLRDRGRRDVEVLAELLDRPDQRLGDNEPADRQPVMLKYLEKLLTTIASSEWASAVSASASYSNP
ncbi:MAG TPA: hypothetical protein VKC99_01910, partial [Methyloceanibacter sp.]|nr:hypothetical protein [Methyloceanibacter sp.]